MDQNCEGIVKWFNRLAGYGFINSSQVVDEVFVHYSQLADEPEPNGQRNLYEGQRVRFDLVDTAKGPAAHNVRRIRM